MLLSLCCHSAETHRGAKALTGILRRVGLVCPPASCSGVAAAFITGLGNVPDLLEDLDTKALVVGVVAGEVAVVLALCVGARAAEDELFPVAHLDLIGTGWCKAAVGVSILDLWFCRTEETLPVE